MLILATFNYIKTKRDILMYYKNIDDLALQHIKDSLDFYHLVSNMKGVHPVEIKASVNRLLHNKHISKEHHRKIVSSMNSKPLAIIDEDFNELPVPHLIDFDWRFSRKGTDSIVKKITMIFSSKQVSSIAFIGCPSLFKYFLENTNYDINFYLIDINASKHITSKSFLRSNFFILNCNVNYEILEDNYSDIKVDMAVIDPPWYPEYYMRFFDICSFICKKKAFVLGVFPPRFTRETIHEEIGQLSNYAKTIGFRIFSIDEHSLEYSTPPFERNVLRENGITNYPPDWRVGDLFEMQRITETEAIQPYQQYLESSASKWQELSIGVIRIKCRLHPMKKYNYFSITIKKIYHENIYPSVSRRFKGCDSINIWTSGNRVFYCNNIPLLKLIIADYLHSNIIQKLESDYGVIISNENRKEITITQDFIRELVDIENKEYGNWGSNVIKNYSDIMEVIKTQINYEGNNYWKSIFHFLNDRQIHLAIMREPYLSLLLNGQKTIESRITENLIAPHQKIKKGDVVVLKKSGGPICGLFEAEDVHFFTLNKEYTINTLKREYNNYLMIQENFWENKKNSKYATLIEVKHVLKLSPIFCHVPNRKAWIFLTKL